METFLIAGLGNPGEKFENTRHNAGFRALDKLADTLGVKVRDKKFKGLAASAVRKGQKLILLKPQTYMNLSGEAVAAAAAYYGIAPDHIIVLSDDAALGTGRLRVRLSGSAGGHNGLKDIIDKLSSDGFIRVRMGVGEQRPGQDLKDHVLGHFDAGEKTVMNKVYEAAAEAVLTILDEGADRSMNRFNGLDLRTMSVETGDRTGA